MPQRYPDPDDAPWALLARHLAAETTPTDQAELHNWLRADPQHLKILATVTRAWERAGEVAPAPLLFSAQDVEAAWRRFQPLMTAPAAPPKPAAASEAVVRPMWPATTSRWSSALKLAAGVVLVAGAAYALTTGPFFGTKKEASASYASVAQRQLVRLPDSSRVWLNAHSQLRYSSVSVTQPRQVQLTGEAYFEVQPAAGRPFLVNTTTAQLRVVGTAFNVRAYAAEDSVEVSVIHGRVWLARLSTPDSVLLTAHTRAALHATDAPGRVPAALRAVPAPNANFRAWQTDTLRFVDAPVLQVAQALRATFGTQLSLSGAGLQQCRFTGTFAHPQPAQVLAVLQVATGAALQATGPGQYTLSGNGCSAAPNPATNPTVN
ncbi:FecR family protein [Hymenobacter negativus]|uniref:FecR domain-containing protein n=1 Tax=Hymenobacter negativus TaxID=2795026 RepID=A0ABS3QDC6_9BACT|nr:FecR domain-containing protein [Hymenobacter negativus]MBO2009251.1 FecR domain-containing protein [Hymenobacter negativus]